MKNIRDKKRLVFSLVFLLVSCVAALLALYIQKVINISAYDFFCSFMPDEEIGYNDDG